MSEKNEHPTETKQLIANDNSVREQRRTASILTSEKAHWWVVLPFERQQSFRDRSQRHIIIRFLSEKNKHPTETKQLIANDNSVREQRRTARISTSEKAHWWFVCHSRDNKAPETEILGRD